MNEAARSVLDHFPGFTACAFAPLGNAGGFSGASLWRVERAGEALALRAASPALSAHDLPTLRWRHQLMSEARGAGLAFVPAVIRAHDGATAVVHAGRLWDLCTWMPGRADYRDHPSPERLRSACTALARLHLAWGAESSSGPCPALARRWACFEDWQRLVRGGWRPRPETGDPCAGWARAAWDLIQRWGERIPGWLAPWSARTFPLQPCLCDVWQDHVLFEGDAVTGMVDYGSVKIDQIAVDLSRLLGSLVGDDEGGWRTGLAAYREVRPLSVEEADLAHTLDHTGTLLGLANWLRWLYAEGRPFPDRAAVARRVGELTARVAGW